MVSQMAALHQKWICEIEFSRADSNHAMDRDKKTKQKTKQDVTAGGHSPGTASGYSKRSWRGMRENVSDLRQSRRSLASSCHQSSNSGGAASIFSAISAGMGTAFMVPSG